MLSVDDRPDGQDNTLRTPCGAVCRLKQVRGDGRDGTAEGFETQLVAHYTHNIYNTEKWIAELYPENGEDVNAYILRRPFLRWDTRIDIIVRWRDTFIASTRRSNF